MDRSKVKMCIYKIGSLFTSSESSKVLYYHDVTPAGGEPYTDMSTPFELFCAHINIVRRNGFEIVDKITKKKGQVQLAFDDGFKGIYDNREYFISNGLKPTVFLATTLIGKPGYLDVEEILELQRAGFVFESHTVSHTNLQKFSDDELKHEVEDSKRELSELLGKEVTEICFPQGLFSSRVIDACQAAGYKKMYSSIPGNYDGSEILIKRNLCQFENEEAFTYILKGGLAILGRHYRRLHYTDKD